MNTKIPPLPEINTRHEKRVLRKQRSKERKDAIARSLRVKPLRSVNTRGLQILQEALGLPSDPCSLPKEQAQEDNFKIESSYEEASFKEELSNLIEAPLAKGTTAATSKLAIPTKGSLSHQEPDLLDAIFIAIDFEHSHYSPKTGRIRLREVGISMFDTRDFRQSNHLKDIISAQHYRTVKDTKEFLFGKTVDILQDELVVMLKRLLYMENEPPSEVRDLILVGHGFGFEIKAMKGLGIDLTLAPSVIQIFDTEFLGYEIFSRDFKPSLSNVVRKTGISGGYFHNAGNDANFTLRAMLLLAIYRYDILKLDRSQRLRLEIYRKLAQF